MIHPIFVKSYSEVPAEACIQRTSELIISTVLDQELQRISDELLGVIAIEAIDIIHYARSQHILKNRDVLIWLFTTTEIAGGELISEIREVEKEFFVVEAKTELEKKYFHYYYSLETQKNSLFMILENNTYIAHLRNRKISYNALLYNYEKFFDSNIDLCYDSYSEIGDRMEDIYNHIERFKEEIN